MAFRIHEEVERGEIDNTVKGTVTGRIWLAGKKAPVILNLIGNCHPDIAGCRIVFSNSAPEACERTNESLSEDQTGEVGDMTASRRVRVLDVPLEEFSAMKKRGETPPEHWGNCLYVEWYSARNGRVVIESTDFDVQVSEQLWQLTEKESEEVSKQSMAAFGGFLTAVEEALPGPKERPKVDDRQMNEFEWEQFMKHSDRRSERFGEVLEKYMDDPDMDRKVDEAMGWNRDEQSGNDDADNTADWQDDDTPGGVDIDLEDLPELVPNPLTEGKHWIMDDGGYPCHPLYKRALEFGISMSHTCKAAGFEGDNRDEDVAEMVFKTHCMSAKLAGALNSLAYKEMPLLEPGFTVAYLKRAQDQLKDALNAHQKVMEKGVLSEHMGAFAEELFALRDEIRKLCDEFRKMGDF